MVTDSGELPVAIVATLSGESMPDASIAYCETVLPPLLTT